VGDIESLPFIEAVRQTRWELGERNAIVIHLTLVPYLKSAGELKTKPTQHSVKTLLEAGIQPDILVCRTEYPLPTEMRKKVALFCNVPYKSVIESIDAESIYDVPLLMKRENLDDRVLHLFGIKGAPEPNIEPWKEFLGRLKNPTESCKIGLVGKYVELKDSYKSIAESFIHAGAATETRVEVIWIKAEELTDYTQAVSRLQALDGILVAPGFGERGIEGKINAVRVARELGIPFFGICLGMQCAVVEFARNVLHLPQAASTEMNADTPDPVIALMESQKAVTEKGGTMRLGAYACHLQSDSHAARAYGTVDIRERHRHRYEFNNDYLDAFTQAGMRAMGINPDENLVEIVELENHPYFVGVQFHPELKSTVLSPHPLFVAFVQAAVAYAKGVEEDMPEVEPLAEED
jgi:CTP synthase